jgi:SprB repeat/Secretion system C-terminal sorting domain
MNIMKNNFYPSQNNLPDFRKRTLYWLKAKDRGFKAVFLFLISLLIWQISFGQVTKSQSPVSGTPECLHVSADVQSVSCHDGSDGAIDLTVSGGKSPYSYKWSTGAKTQDIHTLSSGVYKVLIKDSGNCLTRKSFRVTQPDELKVRFLFNYPICGGQPDGCAYISGGTAPYMIWVFFDPSHKRMASESDVTFQNGVPKINGLGQPDNNFFNTATESPDSVICGQNLPNGHYIVLVVDANGCFVVEDFTIRAKPEMKVSGEVEDVSCYGAADGSIELEVEHGRKPYTYAWSNGETTKDIDNLKPGAYMVTVTDANGCTATAIFLVGQPDKLELRFTIAQPVCGGQPNVCAHISGGTQPYHIWVFRGPLVAPTVMPQPIIKSHKPPTVPGYQALPQIKFHGTDSTLCANNVPDGNYLVLVVDHNGCYVMKFLHIKGKPEMTLKARIKKVSCNGGSDGAIDLTVLHGIPPFTYLWSNGETTEDIDSLPAGIYKVRVKDRRGCTATKAFVVREPDPIVSHLTFDQYGAYACVSPTGGTAPYSVRWYRMPNQVLLQSQAINCIYNLPAGIYMVRIKDANGCFLDEIFIIDPLPPCRAGVAWVNPDTIHSGSSTTLTLLNWSGQSLQWQFKTDFTGWINIPNATTSPYQTTNIYAASNKDVYIRAVVTCYDGTTKISDPDTLFVIGNPSLRLAIADEDLFNPNNAANMSNGSDEKDAGELIQAGVEPNLTTGYFKVNVELTAPGEIEIIVMDLSGNPVMTRKMSNQWTNNTEEFDISGLSNGIYLVRIQSNNTIITKRVIKQ